MTDQQTKNTDENSENGVSHVETHTNIGKPGVIVELRPHDHDVPWEGDMSHLTDEDARDLRDQLDEYLEEDEQNAFTLHGLHRKTIVRNELSVTGDGDLISKDDGVREETEIIECLCGAEFDTDESAVTHLSEVR